MARLSFRQNKSKRNDGAAPGGVKRTMQPQQSNGQTALHRVGGLSFWNSQEGDMGRAAAEKSAHIGAGNRMFEVRRRRQRLERFIGKAFRQEMVKTRTKLFARKVAEAALEFHAYKFEATGLRVAEPFNGKR